MFSTHYHGFNLFHTGSNVFAGYNANKDKKASLMFDGLEIKDESFNNLTLITTRGMYVEKNKEGKYRNSYYSFDLMFPSNGKGDGYSTACFVTQTQADKLLTLSSNNSYEDLIGEKVTFDCDDMKPIELTVFNIILEEGDEFARFTNNFGFFFVANDWEFLRKPFLNMYYFMNTNGFENYQYLKMIKEAYSKSDISVEFNNHNSSIIEVEKMNNRLGSFFKKNENHIVLPTILLIFVIFSFIGFLFFAFKVNKNITLLDALFYLAIPLLPYAVFRAISLCTKSCIFFSYYSTTGLLIIEVVMLVFLLILLLLKSRSSYEIDK
ncbi:hypothetical protein IJS64_04390 [bacterium]|nr:hypothetical protein [bacterium]